MSQNIEEIAREIGSVVGQLIDTSYTITEDRFGSSINQTNDYQIDWQLTVKPENQNSCGFEIFASPGNSGYLFGLFFDTWGAIASRLQLKSSSRKATTVGFGIEPGKFNSVEQVREIILAAIAGRATLQYQTICGWLISTAGTIELASGVVEFNGVGEVFIPGLWKSFRYESWHLGD